VPSSRSAARESCIPLSDLGDNELGALRLRDPSALLQVERSLVRHGQLEPLVVFAADTHLEVVDGFKRLHVARKLGWSKVCIRLLDVEPLEAKILMVELHGHRGLSALEEAWLVRSLCRDHGLTQGAVAERLGRHKSWVCRRLLLAEQLAAEVQASVRLGLLAPRAAVVLAALPRGNQQAAADVVARRGLTVHQTELLVADLAKVAGTEQMAIRLARWAQGDRNKRNLRTVRARNAEDETVRDIMALTRVSARLEARLLGGSPSLLEAGQVVRHGLEGLAPVLAALLATVEKILGASAVRSRAWQDVT
jgi:ParB-like chromosome segregation protein Spo0J